MVRKFLGALLAIPFALGQSHAADQKVLMKAMEDELNRDIKQLRMEKMSPPYYIAYRVVDQEQVTIQAGFGSLYSTDREHSRRLFIDLRVGDYKFDNSNFISQEGAGFMFGFDSNGESENLPLDDDYDALRHDIWLATDGAYKNALEQLSRKKAAIESRMPTDVLDDFSKVKPTVYTDTAVAIELDPRLWQDRIRQFSALFKEYPKIQNSNVSLVVKASNQYFIDSETSRHRRSDLLARIEVSARTQTRAGDTVKNFISFCALTLGSLPPSESIAASIRSLAEELSRAVELEPAKSYTGPVLFLGEAAGDFFYQIVGEGLSDPRPPLFENPMMEKILGSGEGGLAGKINELILPDVISIWDDPATRTVNTTPLVGSFGVDDQGVRAGRVDLVKQGKVSGFLMSRLPTKEVKESNGHARSPGGGRVVGHIGNLFVTSSSGLSADSLKQTFLKLCKDQGLESGIVVTKLARTGASDLVGQVMAIFSSFQSGAEEQPLLTDPVSAYKLSVDGKRVEMVRGLKFEGTTLRVLRDIKAVGAEPTVNNFTGRQKLGEGLPVSVVAPSLVIGEMELSAGKGKPTKPPFLPHPYFQGK